MTRYFYRALKDRKDLVTGHIEADSLDDAKIKVKELGFMPAGIYTEDNLPSEYKSLNKAAVSKVPLKELQLFTSELQVLLKSGISILEALDSLSDHAPGKKSELIVKDVSNKIKNGNTFSEAVGYYDKALGNVYIALCKTGEESGNLPETLGYLNELLKKQIELKNKFIQMSIYPTILVVLMIAMFLVFGGLLFPKIITSMSIKPEDIPLMVKVFTGGYDFVIKFTPLLLLVGVVTWVVSGVTIGFKKIQDKINTVLLSIPVLKDCILYLTLSHYMTVMYIAYNSGITISDTLLLSEGTINISVLRDKAAVVSSKLRQGSLLADAFKISGLLPPVMISIISTGEKTGQLGQMFKDIAQDISTKLDNAISALAKAFEPVMLCVLGAGVAVIAIAIMQMYTKTFESFF
ncbi:MAG: type II secretion system F family protein [Candidatus Gastranaerophilaceae bacterium]|nr:type II secretion system F family protein [Candidatus Gastranaerophilaceae bacterium]